MSSYWIFSQFYDMLISLFCRAASKPKERGGCNMIQTEENISTVKAYYDENALREWDRLERHPFEFLLTTHMMNRYIKPGDRILDIGGGPGRYAIYFAQKGCEVTLVDLSPEHIALACQKAQETGVCITAYAESCLSLDELALGDFDHVFLMGPLYHLLHDDDRVRAVEQALRHLKPGGLLYVTFVLAFAGIIYDLKNGGMIQSDAGNPATASLIDAVVRGENYAGPAFTSACFFHQNHILPFMERFPLTKLHLFGQEGILAPNELDILQRDQAEIDCWITLAKRFLELPELLSYSEHAMYIGRKEP
ncbi:MAG: hypothetical protein ABT01_01710 [Clostridium sp. SCN 57-10]|nr:MAG: hypothetical protein ABT01_01710 [Clostridium sp. SCN 57-10]